MCCVLVVKKQSLVAELTVSLSLNDRHSPTNPSRGCFDLMRMSVKIQRMCLDGILAFCIVYTLYCFWIVWSLCACLMQWCQGIVHTKMKILPLFTLPSCFFPNLWDLLYSVVHRCFEKCVSDFQCNIYCAGILYRLQLNFENVEDPFTFSSLIK